MSLCHRGKTQTITKEECDDSTSPTPKKQPKQNILTVSYLKP